MLLNKKKPRFKIYFTPSYYCAIEWSIITWIQPHQIIIIVKYSWHFLPLSPDKYYHYLEFKLFIVNLFLFLNSKWVMFSILGFSNFTAFSQKPIILPWFAFCGITNPLAFFAPSPPPLWMFFLVSVCAFLHWGYQYDGAWWVPLTGLSWLLSRLACSSLQFHQVPSSHPSIADGFNKS